MVTKVLGVGHGQWFKSLIFIIIKESPLPHKSIMGGSQEK